MTQTSLVGFVDGDHSLLAWATMLVFVVAGGLCLLCAVRADRIFDRGNVWAHRLIWGGMGFLLFFFAVNKQLDWQTDFTVLVKQIAWEQGWYAYGQRLQVLFVFGLMAVALLGLLFFAWHLRHSWRRYWVLLLGLLLLARFITVRAASFYGVVLPEFSQYTGGFRITWLLELFGALILAAAAWGNLRSAEPKESPV